MRNVHSFGFTAALYVAFLLLAGCQLLGVPVPQTFNEKAASALTTVTGARQTALTLLQAQKITPDDAENVNEQADTLRKGVEVARAIHATQPVAGDARLAATITALTALTAYLEERK